MMCQIPYSEYIITFVLTYCRIGSRLCVKVYRISSRLAPVMLLFLYNLYTYWFYCFLALKYIILIDSIRRGDARLNKLFILNKLRQV